MKNAILISGAMILLISFVGCHSSGNKSGSAAGDAIFLKFNLNKGIKFDYSMTMAMNMDQNGMGNGMHMSNKVKMGYIFEVTNDSAGWKTVNTTIDKIGMNVNAGAVSINFDTDSSVSDTIGTAGMMSKVFGAMKGGEFVFTINEKGQVGEVRGMKEMMEKIMEKENTTNGQMMMQSMGKAFDENNFRQNMAQSFAVYPDKPVKPGDSWSKTLTVNSNGLPMKCETTYTLASVDGDQANIKLTSIISSSDSTTSQGLMSLSGTLDGISSYEISSGMLVHGDMDMKMKVKSQQQQTPINMDIQMKMTGRRL